MSSWLKKSNSELFLYHTSDLPYVITNEFVLICDNNMFSETEYKTGNHIGIMINNKKAKRITTYHWCLNNFPIKVATKKVISVHNENKQKTKRQEHTVIATFKDCYIKNLSTDHMETLLNNYDKTYLLSKNATSDAKILEAGELFDEHFYYGKSWYTAIVNILDKVCLSHYRGKNWLENMPQITLDIYGIKQFSETDEIRKVLEDLKISEKVDFVVR